LPNIPPEDVGLVVGRGVTIGKEAEKQGFTTGIHFYPGNERMH